MLRQSIHLIAILFLLQLSSNLKAQLTDNSGNSGPCTLACLDHLTVSPNSAGTAQIWAADSLISDCTRPYTLTVRDSDDNIIFQQLEDNNFWSLTSEDQNKTYLYTVEHNDTGNKCRGIVTVDDKIGADGNEEVSQNGHTHTDGISQPQEKANCAGFPIDFSTFNIEAGVEFANRTFEDVQNELTQSYADAFNLMIAENGLDPESNDYLVGWHLEDEILKEGSDLIEIKRMIAIIDFQAGLVTDLYTNTNILVNRIVTEHGQVQTGKLMTL